jgi:hypothetical protein
MQSTVFCRYAFAPARDKNESSAGLISTTPMLRETEMRFGPFLVVALMLLIFWAGGFLVFHVASGLIHLLLLFAVISLVMHFVAGMRAV